MAAQGHRIYIFKVAVANFYNFVPVLATYGLSRSFEMAFTNCTFTYFDFAKYFLKYLVLLDSLLVFNWCIYFLHCIGIYQNM